MNLFELTVLRIKEQLHIRTDKEVAELLGMKQTAFNERKKRDSFPEDKLLALVARRPDLNIDVAYVLTGDPARVHAVMSNLRAATDIADSMGGSREEKAARQEGLMKSMRRTKIGLTAEQERAGYSVEVLSPAEQRALDALRASGALQPSTINQTITAPAGQVAAGNHINQKQGAANVGTQSGGKRRR